MCSNVCVEGRRWRSSLGWTAGTFILLPFLTLVGISSTGHSLANGSPTFLPNSPATPLPGVNFSFMKSRVPLFSRLRSFFLVGVGLSAAIFALVTPTAMADSLVYLGTFARPPSGGIFVARLNSTTGTLSAPTLAVQATSPEFLAIDAAASRLYSLETINKNNVASGAVTSFTINRQDGRLTMINRQVPTGGGFAHLSLDRTSRFLAASRYNDGNAAIFPLSSDGHVQPVSSQVQHQGSGPVAGRQDRAHVHSVNFDLGNHFAIVADLGTDEIWSYRFDASAGKLTPNSPAFVRVPPGSGPRHFAFHPTGKFAYAVCELNATVISYNYDATRGTLSQTQVTTLLPDSIVGQRAAAEVVVDRAGKFLYVSNRGYDALLVYAINATTGQLTFVQRLHDGVLAIPRNFAIDPTGRWLVCAAQNSNAVTVYAIDAQTGRLTRTSSQITVPQPVCVRFLPLN